MAEAANLLSQAGIAVQLAPTPGPGRAASLAREASRDPASLVIVCGGDGTINEVINGMAPSEAPLAILPGGTANIAAKELSLPHDPVRAARELPGWQPRRLALGKVSWPAQVDSVRSGSAQLGSPPVQCRYFLSVAGVGFDAYVVYNLSLGFKLSLGVVAYGIEAVRQALRHSFPMVACRLDGRELRGTLAVIQRTRRYAGWLHLAPKAGLFQPGLHLGLFTSPNRWRYFLYTAAVLARLHHRLKDVIMLEARSIDCAAMAPGTQIHFEVDGELAGVLPARFEVVPDALTLLVPETHR